MYWSASSTSYASCAACSCDAVQLLGAGDVSDRVDCVTDRGDCEFAASPLRTGSPSESVDCDLVRVRGRRLSRTGGGWKNMGVCISQKNLRPRGSKRRNIPCWVLGAYSRCPSAARSAAYPNPAHSRLGRTGRQGLAHAWRTPPWAEDGGPQMRRG
jgi:hypothetical protein